MAEKLFEEIADQLAKDVIEAGKPKYLKVRTLLNRFNYERRTDDNATKITELLGERNIILNPSIMKFGDTYPLDLDERVYLVERKEVASEINNATSDLKIYDYKNDPWFEEVKSKTFRTEKEVENKFIIPLLHKLGYSDDDRYDGMPVKGAHGAKETVLVVDFALYNLESTKLLAQALMVVEAKMFNKFSKPNDLVSAVNQIKSYSIWLGCHFGLISDGNLIQVIDLLPSKLGKREIFSCSREDLNANFHTLYSLVSKESLTNYYEKMIQ